MKTKSIIYNNFVPQVESTPVITRNESPTFKYTGYKPRYKWSDDNSSAKTTIHTETTDSNQEETSSQIQFQDPSSIDWSKVNGYSQSTTSVTRPRGQHVFKSSDIQVGEMQGLLDAFADAGISLRITSGTRPGATTKQGNQSWHSQGRALDVTPVAGQTFEDLAKAIRNSPDLVAYMKEHGYGIYDETSSDTLSKTGGTGAHWHIGPDKVAIAGLETILKGRKGLKIPILFAKEGTKNKSVVQRLLDTPLKSAVIGNQFQDLDPDYVWKDGELEQAWKEYSEHLKSTPVDNISKYNKTIKDWTKASRWSEKGVPIITAPFILPIFKPNNNGNNKE